MLLSFLTWVMGLILVAPYPTLFLTLMVLFLLVLTLTLTPESPRPDVGDAVGAVGAGTQVSCGDACQCISIFLLQMI